MKSNKNKKKRSFAGKHGLNRTQPSLRQGLRRTKEDFVYMVAHQLQNPLTIINGYADILLGDNLGELKKKQKEAVGYVKESADRMSRLVQSLLNVSRINSGVFIINPVPTNIAEVAEKYLKEYRREINNKKIKAEREYDEDLYTMNADPKILGIIFSTLFSNAIKYTPPRGKIKIEIFKKSSEVVIVVRDNGYGIPKNQQRKIFRSFFRGDNTLKIVPDGSGLGLYILKKVVEKVGGRIWFSSEGRSAPGGESLKNKGTSFYVALPIKGMRKKSGTRSLIVLR